VSTLSGSGKLLSSESASDTLSSMTPVSNFFLATVALSSTPTSLVVVMAMMDDRLRAASTAVIPPDPDP
jgi:hypothetical protein